MVFSGGMNVTKEQLQSGGFGSLTDTIFKFARSLKSMEIDDMEYAALCCICLISGGKYHHHHLSGHHHHGSAVAQW